MRLLRRISSISSASPLHTQSKSPFRLNRKGLYYALAEGLSEGDVIIQNPDEHLTEGAQIKVMVS